MARVTVEDCIVKIPNRFRLVMLAAQRARDLSVGSPLTVERDNDKDPVVALREIAEGTVEVEDLEVGLIEGLQKHIDVDEPEEGGAELLAVEEELAATGGTDTMADNVSPEELATEETVPETAAETSEETVEAAAVDGGTVEAAAVVEAVAEEVVEEIAEAVAGDVGVEATGEADTVADDSPGESPAELPDGKPEES